MYELAWGMSQVGELTDTLNAFGYLSNTPMAAIMTAKGVAMMEDGLNISWGRVDSNYLRTLDLELVGRWQNPILIMGCQQNPIHSLVLHQMMTNCLCQGRVVTQCMASHSPFKASFKDSDDNL